MTTTRTGRPTLRFALGAALVLPLLVATLPAGEAATTRVLAITTGSSGPQQGFAAFDGNPPKLFDINGDGKVEIIAQNDNQYVYVFDSQTGQILFEVKTTFPPSWAARSFNGPEAALMTVNGSVNLVVANSAAYVTSYRFDPGASTSSKFAFTKLWERRLNDCFADPAMDAKPVLADLDRDGTFEILAATEQKGLFALRKDGTTYWKNCLGGGNAEPAVADLNLDGWPDVVHVSDAGVVTALDGRTGATRWSFNVLTKFDLGTGSIPVGAGIGQLDGVGGPDVVVGARDSHDAATWSNDHAALVALDSNGKFLWGRQDTNGGNPLTYTRPVIVDADNDGKPEVYWADWNTNGHKPPFDESQAWQVTGPGNFYRYDAAGTRVWKQSLGTWWSNKDLAIADVDGDGVQEVLASGPNDSGHDGIWYLDARTGAKETFVDAYPWKVQRAPVVADLWKTGTMQWVLEAGGHAPSSGGPAILVYDTGEPYSAAWPRLPDPQHGSPPPPPSGSFDATFNIKAPNAWWQEVFVEPHAPHTIAKVEVRINGAIWKPMTKSSWGAWTSSYNTPADTQVEFRATDADGALSQSAPFTWMDGDLSQESVPPGDPPPPPSSFTATYEVPPGVNEWWVEVRVSASEPVVAVDARVNSGAWNGLHPTDWGTWAKSFFVDAGSQVQFRATSSTGAQNLSQTIAWLSGSGGASFNATFAPCCTDNNWWVEVKVTANHPVTKVEASVNSGAWTALSKTSWGTWAKSFFVADGSQVRFRATDDAANTVVSGGYTWG